MTIVMTDVDTERERWSRNLEAFLEQACQAETRHDYEAASTLFRRALYYDAKLRPEPTDAKAHIAPAGPVYAAQTDKGPVAS